jgi:transketolase
MKIVEMVVSAGEGHIPSSFSIVDILEVLYRRILDVDSRLLGSLERDFFVLSKGHGAAALFAVLHKFGFLDDAQIGSYGKSGGILGGHPDSTQVPGVEASTGSLGHGFPFSVGIALGQKIRQSNSKVYALLGDGECQEGTIWEAAHVAANQRLGNLCAIVDWNKSGAQLTPIDDLPAKWAAFGWDVLEVDGHDVIQVEETLLRAKERPTLGSPLALVAHTVKGKGVSFLEGHGVWHHKVPNGSELAQIVEALS